MDHESFRGRSRILHPFLIAIFPILSVYSHNVYELPLEALAAPLGIALASTIVLWLALRVGMRDAVRSGLITSLIVALFFAFGIFQNALDFGWHWLNALWVIRDTRFHPLLTLSLEGIAIALGSWVICHRVRQPWVWNSYLNAFTLILVALPTVGLVSSRLREPAGTHRDGTLPSLGQKGRTPDIYFIVLDGYARSDIMKENYGFDNKSFLDRLERRGFSIASQSLSNYCQTPLSLASTLNAEYLDKLIEPETQDLVVLNDLIKKNRVADQLRTRGYRTVSFATGFEPTENPDADFYLAPGPDHSPFNDILIALTPLELVLAAPKWDDRFSENRQRTLFTLERLPSIARIPGPTFTFAHLLCPHPPFIFGERGQDVSPRRFDVNQAGAPLKIDSNVGSPDYVRKAYHDQAVYLTSRIDRVIEQIIQQSPEPPVIILQSDHGAWLNYHPDDAEATQLRERFGTLNAILIPGHPKIEGFQDQAILVNTFRVVLNNVFGTRMPLLETRNYFSTIHRPLELIEVTEPLRTEKDRRKTFQPPDQYLGLMQQF